MDGLKLDKWKKDFNREAETLQLSYDSFFPGHRITECYQLSMDDVVGDLYLTLDSDLPAEIESRLLRLFNETRPEDSI